MALRGTLEHLGLAGVLQLIGHNARHGVLTIEHGEEQMNLFFDAGLLVRADGTADSREERVIDRLVAAQLLPHAAVQAAQDLGLRGSQVQEHLVAQGAMTLADLRRFAALHSTEAVYRAIAWSSGSYAFLPAKAPPQASHGGLKSEHLLMEGLRAQDLWPTLRARVPNTQVVFEVCRSLEDYLVTQSMGTQAALKDDFADGFGFEDLNDAQAQAPSAASGALQHNDRLIYGLVDGVRDVQGILACSGLTAVDAIAALVALLDAQLLAPTQREAPAAAGRATAVLAQAPATWRWRFAHVAPAAWRAGFVAAGLALTVGQAAHHKLASLRGPVPATSGTQADAQARFTWQNHAPALMDELELVRARTGSYPKALPTGAMRHDAAALYASEGEGYRLRRPLVPSAVH